MRVYTNVGDPEKKKKKGEVTVSAKKIKSKVPEYSKTVREPQSVSKDYEGASAPRVGGEAEKSTGMAQGTGREKLIRLAKRRAKQQGGSKAAKKARLRAYRGR